MWNEYELVLEFTEPILGTIPKHRDVWSEHVRTQLTGDDETGEVATLAEAADIDEKGWTGFHADDKGRPIMYDYQVKGFLKEAGNTIKDVVKVKALRSHIEKDVFVFPRQTVLAEEPDDFLERPLRAMTMQGPRVTVVRSDLINPGTEYTLHLKVLETSKVTEEVLRACLDYGAMKGLGQWRNGGYGRFVYELTAK